MKKKYTTPESVGMYFPLDEALCQVSGGIEDLTEEEPGFDEWI